MGAISNRKDFLLQVTFGSFVRSDSFPLNNIIFFPDPIKRASKPHDFVRESFPPFNGGKRTRPAGGDLFFYCFVVIAFSFVFKGGGSSHNSEFREFS